MDKSCKDCIFNKQDGLDYSYSTITCILKWQYVNLTSAEKCNDYKEINSEPEIVQQYFRQA